MGDMIDRDAVLTALLRGQRCSTDIIDAIAALPAVTVGAILAKVPTRYQTANGDRLLHESDILAALEPQPAPDACTFPACRCHYEAGNPRCEPAPDAAAMTPEVAKLVEAAKDAIVAMQEARATVVSKREHALLTSAVHALRAALAALRAGGQQ